MESPLSPTLAGPAPSSVRLRHLELRDFRNIGGMILDFTAPRLLVIGANGEGKSNLLEAVEMLASLRSHRCGNDRDLIRHGQSCSRLLGVNDDGDALELRLRRSGGRQALRNGKLLDRQLELIGSVRCVTFSALDLEMVRGEPALRRQWLDRVVLQLEPVYGEMLRRYGRLLRQRRHLWRPGLAPDQRQGLLEAFDQQMALIGSRLHRRRHRALRRLEPLALHWQERLGGTDEPVELRYRSGTDLDGVAEETWSAALLQHLLAQRSEEERLGQCQAGPHRDDVELALAGHEARRYGSAGQQRTLVLALKLAELELVHQVVGRSPLLLLDDVLAELDPRRQQLLLEAVGEGHQCIVSATHVEAFSDGWRHSSQVVEMRRGEVWRG